VLHVVVLALKPAAGTGMAFLTKERNKVDDQYK
jgi:hypothetical protein